MAFIACGLNHKTAPIEIREKFARASSNHNATINALLDEPQIDEAVILSTCNRTELYYNTQNDFLITSWLANHHHMSLEELSPYLYVYEDKLAIQHLLRVCTGLDSMMLGEPQILGQMKQAFQHADTHGTVGPHLRHLFQFIFGASKSIRTHSGIGLNSISVASAAAQLIRQHFSDESALSLLLIGSGETATLVAKYLYELGIRRFVVASRTQEHATTLANVYAGEIIPITDIGAALSTVDIIVSATACPLPFISHTMVIKALADRKQKPMLFLDLAVPRDIEPSVGQLPNVTLYNIDDLNHLTQQGMQQRQTAGDLAEQLIEVELERFEHNHRALRAKDLICNYRNTMQSLADFELQRALQKLAKGQEQIDVFNEFSQRLINKFSHIPSIGLRQAAIDQRDEILDLAHYLFHSPQSTYEDIT